MNTSYQQLRSIFTRISRFNHLSAIAHWDMQTMMSHEGSQARSEALAEIGVLCHQLLCDPKVGVLLEQASQESLEADDEANLAAMRDTYRKAVVLPDALVEARSLATGKCGFAWRTQRPANDWVGFASNLREVIRLTREEAQIRADATGVSRYDALLDLYEPGMRSEKLDRIFGDLKAWLPDLLQRVVAKQAPHPPLPLQGPFDLEKQRELVLEVMRILGFNFTAGRLDSSAHPFSGGVPQDVRITTRYDDNNFLHALFATIHETGHARYEQNLPRAWRDQPVGLARSMGIHESQSLMFEMQLARSTPFLHMLHPLVVAKFGHSPALTEVNFIALVQRARLGLIRVEADEISYPLHVILRYEIEKALVEGEIEVDDIPALWNQKMKDYLGIDTEGNYQNGCMQDIHWTQGAIGYFPTYTLGAMYAAQLFEAARTALPALNGEMSGENLQGLSGWLEENIWSKGSRYPTDELIANATGEALNTRHFRAHLERRYL
jgi:carboxypeptidase Taq